jgi:hypothetical protein
MTKLTSTPFERSNNLLDDIRRLQTQLDEKTRLYNDHIVQGGLQWKAMGFPAQEGLIGLVSELHLSYAKVNSQRESIGDRATEAEYDKVGGH